MKSYKMYIAAAITILSLSVVLSACGNDDSYVQQPQEVVTNVTNVTKATDTAQDSVAEDVEEPAETQVTQSYKRNEYLNRAYSIEEYTRNNLDTAMSQYDMNVESSNVFTMWDNLLNEVYQHLKATMNKSDFSALESDEIRWIKEKESAIEATAAEWYGGTGAPAACNAVGIEYTKERCYYLISLVN